MQLLLSDLFSPQLSPHGFCLPWSPVLLWLVVSADGVIGFAYLAIAAALAAFLWRRSDLALSVAMWMFAIFIMSCGVAHLFDIVTLWIPVYGLQGLVKLSTASVSLLTAIMLWQHMPGLIAMPTPAELRRVNVTLHTVRERQERTEEALRDSERRYQLLVDGVNDHALIMLDARGHITNWNRGAARIYDYAADQIVGQHFSNFYADEDRASGGPERALATAEGGGQFAQESWRVRRDGSRFRAAVVIEPVRDEGGRLLGFAKITHDITDKWKAAEAIEQSRVALAQAQKMEAVGLLTGGIAHDFNNLLTAVLGSLDLIERRGPLNPSAARVLATARQAAERGAELTSRLLAFGRRQALSPKPLDANRLVGEFSDLLRRTLGERITFEIRSKPGLWTTFADQNQLESALLNLAVNARDAMPDGGRLTIETGNATLDPQYAARERDVEPGDYVTIAMRDTGCGMTPDVLERAFDPFFTTKAEGHGTGLGLSQVFGFIKQSGGHVAIQSEPGEGTSITFYLPRHEAAAPSEAAATPAPALPVARGETVLVVEDNGDVRHYAGEVMAELGFNVLTAPDAPTALQVLDSHPEIALLFSDIGLPGLNGRELAQEARRRYPTLRLLLTTGYSRDTIIRQGLATDGIAMTPKPFTYDSLAGKLREVMSAPA